MKSKYIITLFFTFVIACLGWSCGRSGEQNATADELEEAHIAGREAARVFVSQKWEDTLQLQQQLVEASSKASVYDSHPRLRQAFDSTFISTVETVRPEIAAELRKYQKTM